MKLFTNEMPNGCENCPYFHRYADQPCGLCKDHMLHYRYPGDEPWDDDHVMDCPLESLAAHDVEVTKQVCKKMVEYATKTWVQHDDV